VDGSISGWYGRERRIPGVAVNTVRLVASINASVMFLPGRNSSRETINRLRPVVTQRTID
jgi:hypothetical protein